MLYLRLRSALCPVFPMYPAVERSCHVCNGCCSLFNSSYLSLTSPQMSPGSLVSFMLYQQSLSSAFQVKIALVLGLLTLAVHALNVLYAKVVASQSVSLCRCR